MASFNIINCYCCLAVSDLLAVDLHWKVTIFTIFIFILIIHRLNNYFRDKGLNDALTHAVNAFLLFIDLFINSHPPRFSHLIQNLLFGTSYAIFSIIYTFCGGINRSNEPFIYSVLNWKYETSSAVLFAFLTLIFLVFIHCVLTSCIHLRIWIHKKLCDREQFKNTNNNNCGVSNEAYEV